MAKIESLEDFVKVHGLLLAASGLPQKLHQRLFEKLASDTFDGGALFQRRKLVLTSESMPKDSDVFLVDHAWAFRLPDAYKQDVKWEMEMWQVFWYENWTDLGPLMDSVGENGPRPSRPRLRHLCFSLLGDFHRLASLYNT